MSSTANASGDSAQLAAASTLPSTNPTNSNTFTIADAEAKALGLPLAAGAPIVDGYVGFDASSSIWSFSPTATPAQSQYYFIGVAEHEISEVLGRYSNIGTGAYSLMDLFRYSASGQRDLTANSRHDTSSPYFSIDSGKTNLGYWNNTARSGDLGDWSVPGPAPNGNDAFNYAGSPGNINALSPSDLTLMNVLGYDLAPQCFMAGTLIRTPEGEFPVEQLARGDFITTADGRDAPVTWIGRRLVSTLFGDPLRVLPDSDQSWRTRQQSSDTGPFALAGSRHFLKRHPGTSWRAREGSSIVREQNVPTQFT